MDKKKNRHFRVSCGLREGYEISATEHSFEEVRQVLGTWMTKQMNAGKKIVTGTLLSGDFVYPMGEVGNFQHSSEPAINFVGQVREDASEEDAAEMLTDLANVLASSLKQKRVHIEYCSDYWVIET